MRASMPLKQQLKLTATTTAQYSTATAQLLYYI